MPQDLFFVSLGGDRYGAETNSQVRIRVQSQAAPPGSQAETAQDSMLEVLMEIFQPGGVNQSDWTIWRSVLSSDRMGNGAAHASFFAIRSANPSKWTCVSHRTNLVRNRCGSFVVGADVS
jgi:hypothetical protein